VDEDMLHRGCWALALLTEVYRIGGIPPGSALHELRPDPSVADLLRLAPLEAVQELGELAELASDALLPMLRQRAGLWALGPTFAGSRLMNADADLIAAGVLLEVKTTLGRKRADGSRFDSLDGATLYQIIGYALLDFPDEFALTQVGLYMARYGRCTVWPLADLLAELAGRPVDLAAERHAFSSLLRA
jgi:hypothetical protein